jgi:DNA-binding CsgD family transcriptional regulator
MLGDTEAAAEAVEPFITGAPSWDTVNLYLDQAIVAMLRGDLSGAEARWAEVDALILPGGEAHYYSERWLVELELWQHRPGSAAERALRALDGLSHMVSMGLSGPMLVLGVRAFADQCEQRSFGVTPVGAALRARLQQAHDGMPRDPFLPGPLCVTAAADRLAWDAEWARARGDASADLWNRVAVAYGRATRPHLVAYCRWRQAEVLLAERDRKRQAVQVLQDAARLATGHAPLLAAIKHLATRARIDLAAPKPSPATPEAPYGLTPRELTVLRLLGQGRSNGQIGTELFISTKTASVHVSNILRKMQVPTRVAAATIAAQVGLLEGSSGERRDLPG